MAWRAREGGTCSPSQGESQSPRVGNFRREGDLTIYSVQGEINIPRQQVGGGKGLKSEQRSKNAFLKEKNKNLNKLYIQTLRNQRME